MIDHPHARGIIKIFEDSDWKDLKIIMLRKDSSFPKTEEQSKSDEKSFKRNKNLAINAKKKDWETLIRRKRRSKRCLVESGRGIIIIVDKDIRQPIINKREI